MIILEFHHLGIATENINEMISYLTNFFEIVDISQTVYDPNQDATLCMLTMKDGLKIELISGKMVENILKKRLFLYHTCYTVLNIDEMIQKLISNGAMLVSPTKEAILFGGKKVAFLSSNLGLIELLEGDK